MKCFECGETMASLADQQVPFEAGVPHVWVRGVTIYTCGCGEVFRELPPLAPLLQELTHLVGRRAGRLSGAEIRFLRRRLGASGKAFAKAFCVSPETVSRWENDKSPMGEFQEKILRQFALEGRSLIEDYGDVVVSKDECAPAKGQLFIGDFQGGDPNGEGAAAAQAARG